MPLCKICGKYIPPQELSSHQNSCVKSISCPTCKVIIQISDLEDHIGQCQGFKEELDALNQESKEGPLEKFNLEDHEKYNPCAKLEVVFRKETIALNSKILDLMDKVDKMSGQIDVLKKEKEILAAADDLKAQKITELEREKEEKNKADKDLEEKLADKTKSETLLLKEKVELTKENANLRQEVLKLNVEKNSLKEIAQGLTKDLEKGTDLAKIARDKLDKIA